MRLSERYNTLRMSLCDPRWGVNSGILFSDETREMHLYNLLGNQLKFAVSVIGEFMVIVWLLLVPM
jgi:hypothetical protein